VTVYLSTQVNHWFRVNTYQRTSLLQARRQDLAAGGAKNQKEGPKIRRGATFLKCSIGCM